MDATARDQEDDASASPFRLLRSVAEAFETATGDVDVWRITVNAIHRTGFSEAAIIGEDGPLASSTNCSIDEYGAETIGTTGAVTIVEPANGRRVLAIPIDLADEPSKTLVLNHEGLPTATVDLDDGAREQYREVGEFVADHAARRSSSLPIQEEVSTQRRTFRKMHSVATQMVGAEFEEGVYHLAIDAAENILEFDICTIDLVEDEEFVPVAMSSGLSDESTNRVSIDYGIAGKTYQSGTSIVVDDLRENDVARPADESFRSMLSVPIDDFGVFQAVTEETGSFDETDADLAELLMSYVSQTLSRIRSEDALRAEEARYRTLVEQSHDAVVTISDDSISFINDRGAALLGDERETIREAAVWKYLHEEDRERVRNIGRDLRTGERDSATFDARIVPADGETRFCEISAKQIDWDDELALLATVRDVTERKEYERELERQNDRLDEFASVVSHDLRNPLTVAQGHVELAAETGDVSELQRVTDALDRIEDIVEGVLTLARNGRQVEDPDDVTVATVADEAWTTVDVDEGTLNVLTRDMTVRADEGRLRRLFENLFRNAADHAGPAPSVTVRPLDDGFVVTDDGPGIPDDQHDDVFDRGFSTVESGTGFGLAIVQNIATAHGWTVASVPSDDGARFEFHDVRTRQSPATD